MSSDIAFRMKSFQLKNEHLKDPKYKTQQCKNWNKTGSCPYKNKCRFAHGKDELMQKELDLYSHFKGRCFNFFKYGFCESGSSCCFKHDNRKISDYIFKLEASILFSLSHSINSNKNDKRLSIFKSITLTDNEHKDFSKSLDSSSKSRINSLNSTQEEIEVNIRN